MHVDVLMSIAGKYLDKKLIVNRDWTRSYHMRIAYYTRWVKIVRNEIRKSQIVMNILNQNPMIILNFFKALSNA